MTRVNLSHWHNIWCDNMSHWHKM